MNKVIDKGFRICRFISTIVKHPVLYLAFRVATNSNCNVQVICFQRGPKQQF